MNIRNNNFVFFITGDTKYSFRRSLVSLTVLLLLSSNCAFAEEAPNLDKANVIVPEKIAGVATVTAEQVIESLTSDNPPLLIDARIKQDREYGYIESSISLPDIKTNCDTLNKVSSNKNRHIMFYCNGVQCGRSVISIKVARSCGYHNLSWFRGGFAEWKAKGYQYIKNDRPF